MTTIRSAQESLAIAIIARLNIVQNQLTAFSERLDETKARLAQFNGRMRTWILTGQCLTTLLLVWIGAGQCALLLQGWRILRSRPVAI
jgi:hypothetical protein